MPIPALSQPGPAPDHHARLSMDRKGFANAFTTDDLSLLTVVAGYLAGALGIARLHEHMQDLFVTDPLAIPWSWSALVQ